MKTTLYHFEDEDITIDTEVILEDGKLLIDGFDYGDRVKKIRGISDEYEYKLSLDEENTTKFFESLGIANKTDREKLSVLKDKFKDDSEIRDYCKKHGIKTEFFCWP